MSIHNGKSVGMESRIVGSPTFRDIDIDLTAWSDLTIRSFQSSSANSKKKHRHSQESRSLASPHISQPIHGMNRSFIRLPRSRIFWRDVSRY